MCYRRLVVSLTFGAAVQGLRAGIGFLGSSILHQASAGPDVWVVALVPVDAVLCQRRKDE